MEIAYNKLDGLIPPEFGNLLKLKYLNLSNNNLTGPIPQELGKLSNIEIILSNNTLTGPIPQEFGNLSKLKTLSLSNNTLSGPIPKKLKKLNIKMNISNNPLLFEISENNNLLIIILVVSRLFVILLSVAVYLRVFRKKKNENIKNKLYKTEQISSKSEYINTFEDESISSNV
ncbi:L domain-like protein [Piromyces finnis]|uniref:L domain-like protein n=1 Tax=Piromyces finnis TaxID=1754191 RepID=A0A1Y1UZA6_9FUNG|nr:L domain-like protein [Piromyces finnis]|eukprot:ORX43956.1 L domain-like protein [Piromyces finnis]